MTHTLDDNQLSNLEITERIASCFSLLGTSFIFLTFIYSSSFRRPVNRLIFYASWGNLITNIATLISQTGPRAGQHSSLCQAQAFLIQAFLPADALWNLAMAINVYLTLFRKYSSAQLKALEWKYHLMCYGSNIIIAVTYLLYDGGTIYGKATLWCWIDTRFVKLRIITCYLPAWICIIISFTIYILAGREIFIKRRQLRAFNSSNRPAYIAVENPFTSFKTTEVHVTSELAEYPHSYGKLGEKGDSPLGQYTVTINAMPASPTLKSPSLSPNVRTSFISTSSRQADTQRRNNRAALEANTAAWSYTKIAILFFFSLLITWVPSSVNRVYSVVHPDEISVPFTYASAIVLPLMGFWNSVIYTTTSWAACKTLFSEIRGGKKKPITAARRQSRTIAEYRSRKSRADSISDSVRALEP